MKKNIKGFMLVILFGLLPCFGETSPTKLQRCEAQARDCMEMCVAIGVSVMCSSSNTRMTCKTFNEYGTIIDNTTYTCPDEGDLDILQTCGAIASLLGLCVAIFVL